jgi:hypothetical protein
MAESTAERVARLDELRREGRVIRSKWVGTDEQGRATACLLAALAPEVVRQDGHGDAARCPAEVMPAWLARFTPWLDDSGTLEAWPSVVSRYAACAARWSALDASAWARLHWAVRGAIVREARSWARGEASQAACDRVIALCDSGAASPTGELDESERLAARQQADAAAYATAAAAAAYAAADAVAAAYAAVASAYAAAAAYAAYAAAARQQASDRIADAVLTALERSCGVGT